MLSRKQVWGLLTDAGWQIEQPLSNEDFALNAVETWHFGHWWKIEGLLEEREFELSVEYDERKSKLIDNGFPEIRITVYLSTDIFPDLPNDQQFSGIEVVGGNLVLTLTAESSEESFLLALDTVIGIGMDVVDDWLDSEDEESGSDSKDLREARELELEFDLAVAHFRAGNEKKAIRGFQALAKKGHSPSIWEVVNLAILDGRLREAKKLAKFETNPAQALMLEATIVNEESGMDVALYERAFEAGHAGAAITLSRHFANSGKLRQAKTWASKAESLGVIEKSAMNEHWNWLALFKET